MSVQIYEFQSTLLQGNPLGDSPLRRFPVYTPEGPGPFPLLFALAGFTGTGLSFLNYNFYSPNLPQRLDQLIAEGMPPAVVVMVDAMTALGGNQYIDSSAVGPWASHIVEELIPWAEEHLPVKRGRAYRGAFGSSSGGYGALMLALKHPEALAGVASHAGDAYFQYCYQADFPAAINGLRRAGGLNSWMKGWRGYDRLPGWAFPVANIVAMSAFYSPDPEAEMGFQLPFDLSTGALRPEIFQRWLEWDPVRLLPSKAEALKALRLLYLDVGERDEYHLQHGARILVDQLKRAGVDHHYEEFNGGHRGISYRYARSLPMLVRALA